MDDQKRGKDAEDVSPKPHADTATSTTPDQQDAANYKDRKDQGKAISVEDVSSANDE